MGHLKSRRVYGCEESDDHSPKYEGKERAGSLSAPPRASIVLTSHTSWFGDDFYRSIDDPMEEPPLYPTLPKMSATSNWEREAEEAEAASPPHDTVWMDPPSIIQLGPYKRTREEKDSSVDPSHGYAAKVRKLPPLVLSTEKAIIP